MSRMVLRPGLTPVRHDDQQLQVGSVVLPDSAEVRRLLTALSGSDSPLPDSLPALRALSLLSAAGLVVPAVSSLSDSVLAAAYGPSWPARSTARAATAVSLVGPSVLTSALAATLAAAGIAVGERATLAVVLSLGPLRRDALDGYVQAGVAHLPVVGSATGWEIGPLVVPGMTACLRCTDLALTESSPRRAVVLDQLARSTAPMPIDPVAQSLALALAAREVLAFVDGDEPASWSATLTVPVVGLPSVDVWARHPLCGCAWDALALDSAADEAGVGVAVGDADDRAGGRA